MSSNGNQHTNRLAQEKSPYLLQHAHNPVDWYPWGDEAFARARTEQKPIFLSIGYSTCHWCHVMERESFEDPEVAGVMNELFVNVKVDREERPDVDRVYMSYVQAISGSGGWPMSVFLTPQLEPFFGGTYFPPQDRHGRPGFVTLLHALDRAWTERRADVVKSAQSVLEQLRESATESSPDQLEASAMQNGYRVFERIYDALHGGFGDAPKFPRAATFTFLMRHYDRTRESRAAEMVVFTLRKMAAGGMYDQLGGGFHRYSVDRRWHVPHFEKMLYDQAQLVRCYLEAYQLTGDPQSARIARETCNYVLRDLTDAATGGFFSAEDADSLVTAEGHEKKEGAFYVFAHEELVRILTPDQLRVFVQHYGCKPEGNAEDPHGELTGKNVLYEAVTVEETAATAGFSLERTRLLLEQGREKALALRNTRPRPHLDDKILCAWNGLLISALARAHQALGATQYLDAAIRAATFIASDLHDPATGTLYRRWRDGERAFPGYLEDHAFLAEGLLDLYEASFDTRWLRLAEVLTERMVELFADREGGGFFSTSGQDASVLVRLKDDHDGAEPAGSSVAAFNLLRLAELAGRDEWAELARASIRCFGRRLRETPHAMPLMLAAWDLADRGASQVVLAGDRGSHDLPSILEAIHRGFVPNKVLLLADDELRSQLGDRLPYIREMKPEGASIRAFVCREKACAHPTTEPERVAALLAAPPSV